MIRYAPAQPRTDRLRRHWRTAWCRQYRVLWVSGQWTPAIWQQHLHTFPLCVLSLHTRRPICMAGRQVIIFYLCSFFNSLNAPWRSPNGTQPNLPYVWKWARFENKHLNLGAFLSLIRSAQKLPIFGGFAAISRLKRKSWERNAQ